MDCRYLTKEDILSIHSNILKVSGGSVGIRDEHRIEAMVERPQQNVFGKELYPDIFSKASVYFEIASLHHPFTDGNKRSAFMLAAIFLASNGYDLSVSNKKIEVFVLKAVIEKYAVAKIAEWFKKHSERL